MAMPVQPHLVGVDVSKAELVICQDAGQWPLVLPNEAQAISRWLDSLPAGPLCLAVEATNTFHLELIFQAHRRGHCVYLIDGFRLNRYRQSIGGRAKTDATDALLLRRYLERERSDLRPWEPPSEGYRALQQLLRRRAVLIRAKVALEQSLRELPELKELARDLARQLTRLEAALQTRLREVARRYGWQEDIARCQGIEGVGPITSAALVMAYQRGRFRSSDAFIAFMGLDVRVRDSGTLRGRRKLTKQGDPELRRLLHLAAMTASRSAAWQGFYQRYLARGFSKIQALVVLARKLARIAFALLRNQSTYQPKTLQEACLAT
jgi:transposase